LKGCHRINWHFWLSFYSLSNFYTIVRFGVFIALNGVIFLSDYFFSEQSSEKSDLFAKFGNPICEKILLEF
jgi:hypothetical protein